MKSLIPLFFIVALILMAQGCSHSPIMKGCKLLGQTSKGEEIYKDCEDI